MMIMTITTYIQRVYTYICVYTQIVYSVRIHKTNIYIYIYVYRHMCTQPYYYGMASSLNMILIGIVHVPGECAYIYIHIHTYTYIYMHL